MIDVHEICQKLKPIIGKQAEQYWLAYLVEDTAGKKEMADTLQLIAVQLLGMDLDNPNVHLSVPSKTCIEGEYPIGSVFYAGHSLFPFGLRESEIIQHIGIFGRTGAGKTNTVFQLVKNFLDREKPFLIFDWKRNYRDLLIYQDKKILVYTVGGSASPLRFKNLNPT